MGARGPVAKRTRRALTSEPLQEFNPPPRMCREARAQWAAYWSDPVSMAPTQADRGVLLRWVESVNRYVVSVRAADLEPLVRGSTGQDVVNPLYKIAEIALAAVERCERQLGIGSKNRADLGIAIISEKRSLQEINQRYEEPAGADDDQDEADEDPRLTVVDGKTGEVLPSRKVGRPRRQVS